MTTTTTEIAAERLRPAGRSLIAAYVIILFTTAILVVIGLVMTMSAESVAVIAKQGNPYRAGLKQASAACVGIVLGLVLAHIRFTWWRPLAWAGFVLALLLQGLAVFGGVSHGGNTNWIDLGFTEIQPSELLKLALALWLANVLAFKRRALNNWFELAVPGLIGFVGAIGLVVKGHDAGTASIIAVIGLGTLVIAGVPWRKTLAVTGVLAIGGAVVMATGNRRLRMEVLLNPAACDEHPDACWQIKQAAQSLAQGGPLGQGLGASRAKWAYLTQADSDFIFAIIGEELGMVGCLVVLILFALLVYALLQVVRLHPNRFAAIATGAIACWIGAQALINVGMVLQVLPVIGVPLPFVSAGGTALMSCLAGIGLVIGLVRGDPRLGPLVKLPSRRARRAAAVVARVRKPGS